LYDADAGDLEFQTPPRRSGGRWRCPAAHWPASIGVIIFAQRLGGGGYGSAGEGEYVLTAKHSAAPGADGPELQPINLIWPHM